MAVRPMYESANDRVNETNVVSIIAPKWKCEAKKLPTSYFIDWVLMRDGKAAAFMEVKCRKNLKSKYPTLMLSLAKWMHGQQFAQAANVPFFVAVEWEDGIFWHKAGDVPVTIGFGGRVDRGDDQDMEPVVFIPVAAFKRAA